MGLVKNMLNSWQKILKAQQNGQGASMLKYDGLNTIQTIEI